jgi:phosphatidylglycerol lysyltransferase
MRPSVLSLHWLLVLVVVVSAFVNLLAALLEGLPERLTLLSEIVSFEFRAAGHLTSALSGFALLLLARGLSRRQRNAWWLTFGVSVLTFVAHLVTGLDAVEAALTLVVMVLLVVTRKQFVARSDAPSLRRGVQTLLFALAFSLLYGTVGFFFLDRQFGTRFDLAASLRQTLIMFTFGNPPLPQTRFAKFFLDSVYVIAGSSLGFALLMLLRPVIVRTRPDEAQWQRAERIVNDDGVTGLAPFAVLGDKQFYFSGNTLVSYKVVNGIGLALGDPIGAKETVPGAIQDFRNFCAERSWKTVFYQTQPDFLEVYRKGGFTVLPIGQDAIVDLNTFTTAGSQGKNFRATLNKLSKSGYHAVFYKAPQTSERLAHLKAVSDEWLGGKQGTEKSFSLGFFEERYVGRSQVMTFEDNASNILAFINLVNVPQKNELVLDLMRHKRDVPSETMLFLILEALRYAKEQEYERFNLGLAALSGLDKDGSLPERALSLVYEHFNQFYNFKGLYGFKSKFHPQWERRYLVYPSQLDIGSALQAVAAADAAQSLWAELWTTLKRYFATVRQAQP